MHGFSTFDKPSQVGSIISSTNIGITLVIFQQGMINVLINKKKIPTDLWFCLRDIQFLWNAKYNLSYLLLLKKSLSCSKGYAWHLISITWRNQCVCLLFSIWKRDQLHPFQRQRYFNHWSMCSFSCSHIPWVASEYNNNYWTFPSELEKKPSNILLSPDVRILYKNGVASRSLPQLKK